MFSSLSSSSYIPSLKDEARATDNGGSSSSMPAPTPIADQPQPGLHTVHYPRPSRPTRVPSFSSSKGSVHFDPEETRPSAAIELDPIGPPFLPPMPVRPRPVHIANGRRAAAATCPARIHRASIVDHQPDVNRFRTRPLAGWYGWYDRYGNPLPPKSLSTHSASSVAWAVRENSWDDSCPRLSHVEPVDPNSVPRPLKEPAKRQHDFEDWLESIVEEARERRDEHPEPTTEGFKRRVRGHWHTFTDKVWGLVFSTWCKIFLSNFFLSNFFASGCCAPCCNIGLNMLFGLCQCGVGGHPNY
ncbi:MAG: hypothetical protein M1826_001727 [Phylliscum demangeonii]|nr:MAG: hypothetical protein M1826_001727 [Phylliscum demangeonii]